MIVAAVICTPSKMYALFDVVDAIQQMPQVDRVYINIEGWWDVDAQRVSFLDLFGKEWGWTKPIDWDRWLVASTTWREETTGDQGMTRIPSIVTARNMCIDYAMLHEADHLLFIDADVIPLPSGLSYLLELDVPLCGGLVPGRGAHSHVNYLFGGRTELRPNVTECAHGTCGYMLIHKTIFGIQRFRWGPNPKYPDDPPLTEDPAYCYDYTARTSRRFVIHSLARAKHIDDPLNPLTAEGAYDGYQARD